MAAIDNVNFPKLTGAVSDAVRALLAVEMWKWYEDHQNDKITTVRFWVINVTVHVHELRPLFVMLFGEPLGS
jgi:hypothetical protein